MRRHSKSRPRRKTGHRMGKRADGLNRTREFKIGEKDVRFKIAGNYGTKREAEEKKAKIEKQFMNKPGKVHVRTVPHKKGYAIYIHRYR